MEAQTNAPAAEQSQQTAKNGPRKDVYGIVTERIIEQLKKGTVPWRKPWTEAGVPMNLVSRRAYRGINVMLLAMLGYERNLFLTFKQVRELGGTVAKGEHGHMVVYWNYVEREQAHAAQNNGTPIEHLAKKVPLLRYYSVFNISQCDGLPEKYLAKPENNWAPIETCDEIVDQMPNKPKITHKEQKAYYDPLKDYVNMPKYNTFDRPEAYYATLFHELVHSTGHRSRLDRKDLLQMAEFGSEPYSHEELVAEIGTCYLQSYAAIRTDFEQSTAYIQAWLTKLQNDHRFIFSASTHAQKATDYILNSSSVAEDAEQKEQ